MNRSVEGREKPAGYRMIKSFDVQKFRCFDHLELRDLRRINIVVGRNAVGKTALLEALRLGLGGTPQVAWTLNQLRGMAIGLPMPPTREQFEAIWSPYFFGFDDKKSITTECTDTNDRKATLKLFYDPAKAVTPTIQHQFIMAGPVTTIIPLVFERINFDGISTVAHATVSPQGQFVLEPAPELGQVTEFFPSTWFYNPQQNATWFSQLSLQNREQEVVETVKREFKPTIVDLSVLAPAPNQIASVHASVADLPNKIPLSLVSAGINKFFTILTAILTYKGGVVLVDEVENGLHYQRLPALWATLLRLTTDYNTQIFVTTHSWECLKAADEAIKVQEEDFSLIRIEHSDSRSTARQFFGRQVRSALEQNGEVR
jgi:predicted ATPase